MKRQQVYDANFAWWGKRDYVHGSHMIYQLLEAMEEWGYHDIENIVGAFRFKLHEQGTYLLLSEDSEKAEKENCCATFKIKCHDKIFSVGLIGNGRPVEKVLPDDESDLISNCNINKGRKIACIENFLVGRSINVIIALNKRLLHETIDSAGYQPWYMAQLNLDLKAINTLPSKVLTIRVDNIIGDRMTKSSIEINQTKKGEIFFARKPIT